MSQNMRVPKEERPRKILERVPVAAVQRGTHATMRKGAARGRQCRRAWQRQRGRQRVRGRVKF